MSFNIKKYLIYFFWFAIVLSGPITILRNSNSLTFSDPIALLNFFQRLFGMLAFSLLFMQIILGSFLDFWLRVLGAKAYRLHTQQGLFSYALILIHPIIFSLINLKIWGILAFLASFLPGKDLFLNFGKMAFLFLTIGIAAAYFRTKPFFRRNFIKFHYLNYLAFFFVRIHAGGLGSDVKIFPFSFVFNLAPIAVSIIILYKHAFLNLKKNISQTSIN